MRDRYAGALRQPQNNSPAPGLSPARQLPIGLLNNQPPLEKQNIEQQASPIPPRSANAAYSPGAQRFGQQRPMRSPIQVRGGARNVKPNVPPQDEPVDNPYSPINRSNIPLNQRIHPDYNPRTGAFSPSRQNQVPNDAPIATTSNLPENRQPTTGSLR